MINLYNTEEYTNIIERAVKGAFKHFDIDKNEVEIELELLSEEEIQELNRDERDIDKVTDVLSFPSLQEVTFPFEPSDYADDVNPETDCVILGEIYICLKRAIEQAEEYGHSVERELGFLATHGVLHLLGYDHVEEEDRAEMEELQDVILNSVGITRNGILPYEEEVEEELPSRCGYAVILGRPNAGKSTLINQIIGEKVSIVSWKPQTTRNRIIGILNDKNHQIIFVDTPGIHAPKNELGKFMMHSVKVASEGVDAVIYVVDAEKGLDLSDVERIKKNVESGNKVLVAVNKVDHVTKEKVAEILIELNKLEGLTAVVPISALRGKNVDALVKEIKALMPIGEKMYSEDQYTDRNMRFMASEIIREKALRLLDKEIPYGIAVSINKYEYRENGILDIDADVIVQKQQHKPIVLGKKGEMIKRISTYARQDLEEMTGDKIFMTLWVRVKEDWRDDIGLLNNLGYNKRDDA
ncbi:MAG: GTPase Era [Clostridia bacterium]|nr:GTPase Era [Clostridia bacterium]